MVLGISKDDMEFAFERHATSKIRKADDLEDVKSMGFRGEALASIAAIANVEMISRTEDNQVGNRIVVEGGKILEQEEAASQVGTTITITNLFFNTPVRYKFLKKDFTEAGYIEDAVTRIALANPNVSIKLINTNKTVIQTIGNGNLKDVIYGIYGKEIAEGIVNVDYQYEDIKIEGVVGKPEIARNNRSYQMFFVNKRYIKDKTLTAASEQAFKGLLTIGKYGFLVLNVEIEPRKIDVNVHPTKLEIRWSEEQKVFKALYHAIRESLLKEDLIKSSEESNQGIQEEVIQKNSIDNNVNTNNQNIDNLNINQNNDINDEYGKHKSETIRMPSFINIFKKKEQEEQKEKIIENDSNEDNTQNHIEELFNKKNHIEEVKIPEKEDNIKENYKIPSEEQVDKMTNILSMQKDMEKGLEVKESDIEKFDEMYVKTFGKLPQEKAGENKLEKTDYIDLSEAQNISVFQDTIKGNNITPYKYIGALFSTYLVIEIKDEIYIVDQHAAHERIMYEKVKKNFYSEQEKDSQIMLLPDIITLSHKEKDIVRENTDLFKKAGFIFEEFGDNTIRLIGVPSLCMELDTKELFIQILDEIDTVAITASQEKEDKFISTIACKAAVKAKMNLNKEEVDNLMKELLVLPNPFTCPHGRPTAIKMSKYDIERKFSRK